MPDPRKLSRSDYDHESQVLTLTYESGHQVRIRGVNPERAVRLMARASAESQRGTPTDQVHFTRH